LTQVKKQTEIFKKNSEDADTVMKKTNLGGKTDFEQK